MTDIDFKSLGGINEIFLIKVVGVQFGHANVFIDTMGTIVFDLSIKPDALDVWVCLSLRLHIVVESAEYALASGIFLDVDGLDPLDNPTVLHGYILAAHHGAQALLRGIVLVIGDRISGNLWTLDAF